MNHFFHALKRFPLFFYKALLCLSASSYVAAIFFVKQKILLPGLQNYPEHISYVIYFLVPMAVVIVCIWFSKMLMPASIDCQICEVELANNSFLPSYLGYFFVALSIPDMSTFVYVYTVIIIFTYLSQTLSYNPLFLLLGFQFYFVTAEDGTKVFLITKQSMKDIKDLELNDLRRMNDFTYIDMR